MIKKLFVSVVLGTVALVPAMALAAAPDFMSPQWASDLCTAWNQNSTLTTKLAGDWIKNNGHKGYKVMEISDSSLKSTPPVQLEIAPKDGKANSFWGFPWMKPVTIRKVLFTAGASDFSAKR